MIIDEDKEVEREAKNHIKAVEAAQKKLKKLIDMDKKYLQFYFRDAKDHIRKSMQSKEFSGTEFNETGYLLLIGIANLEVKVSWNKLRLFIVGLKPEVADKIKGKISDLESAYDRAMKKYHNKKNSSKDARKVDYEEHIGGREKDLFGSEDELLGLVNSLFDEIPTNQDVEAPEEVSNRYVPFDFDRLEKDICGKSADSAQSIKSLGGGLELAESREIGITVVFQACLQLENDGRVALDQGEGDVLVRKTS
jgi:hypothetical protein